MTPLDDEGISQSSLSPRLAGRELSVSSKCNIDSLQQNCAYDWLEQESHRSLFKRSLPNSFVLLTGDKDDWKRWIPKLQVSLKIESRNPGMTTSRIRQRVWLTQSDPRNFSADENARAEKPNCLGESGGFAD